MYYVRRLVRTSHECQDVLQDTWLQVFRSLGRLQSPQAFRVWLYRIAYRRAVTHARRRADEMPPADCAAESDSVDSWNELVLLEDAELVHNALERLTSAHREVLTLRFLEDMDVKEIAEVVGCREGTAKSRLHYAKWRCEACSRRVAMRENHVHRNRVAALVAQDQEINESQLKEFRMQLEQSLSKWERDGRTVRRAAWIAVVVLLADYLVAIPLAGSPNFHGKDILMFLWAFAGIASLILALFLTVLYKGKYAPRISQARFDLQMTMLRDLQEQVETLRKNVRQPPE